MNILADQLFALVLLVCFISVVGCTVVNINSPHGEVDNIAQGAKQIELEGF